MLCSPVSELDGIGVKIAKKIQEILDTGKLNKLEKLLANPDIVAVNLLCRVSGVGPQAAQYELFYRALIW